MSAPRLALPHLAVHPRAHRGCHAAIRTGGAGWLIGAALLLAACSPPEPPEKERPPVPKSAAPARHTELRDAIQAPQDKARAVEGAVDDAAKAQREAIEAAGG